MLDEWYVWYLRIPVSCRDIKEGGPTTWLQGNAKLDCWSDDGASLILIYP